MYIVMRCGGRYTAKTNNVENTTKKAYLILIVAFDRTHVAQ